MGGCKAGVKNRFSAARVIVVSLDRGRPKGEDWPAIAGVQLQSEVEQNGVEELVKQATQQAARSNLIGDGKTPVPPPGEQARKTDRDHAVADLELAFSQGFTDFSRLKDDPDLVLLLDRQELKQVIEHTGPPGNPLGRK